MKSALCGLAAAAVLALAIIALLALALPVLVRADEPEREAAAMHCGNSDDVRAALAAVGEHEAGRGITAGGILMQLYTAPGGTPWALIITRPSGEACLLARGLGWEAVAIPEGSL